MQLKYLLLLLLFGCSRYVTIPNQTKATEIVWNMTYGSSNEVAPPNIEWIFQKDLDCGYRPDGYFHGFLYYIKCMAGLTTNSEYLCQVAHPHDFRWTDSAFAHELAHAFLFRRTGDGDPLHLSPMFQPGGAVDVANYNLANEGLY